MSKEALAAVEVHPWPGNIRELENRIKRAVIMSEGLQIGVEDLELAPSLVSKNEEPITLNLREVRDNAERQALQRALRWFDGNVSHAAEVLGVSRPTLYDLMNKYQIKLK